MREAFGGFGDPVIVFFASLPAIRAGLEAHRALIRAW
jgi:hypothetical protein